MHGSTGPVLDIRLLPALSQSARFGQGIDVHDTGSIPQQPMDRKMHSSVLRHFGSQSYKNTEEGDKPMIGILQVLRRHAAWQDSGQDFAC